MTEAYAMQMVERHGARKVVQVLLGIIKQLKSDQIPPGPAQCDGQGKGRRGE